MRLRSLSLLTAASLVPLALVPAMPAAADWLVTTEGAAIETDGPWEVKGRLVVFRQADGNLASLRASKVDLDASARLTEARELAAQAPPALPPAPPKYDGPKLVLTDDDVGRYIPPPSEEDSDAETEGDDNVDGEEAATTPAPGGQKLSVSGWQLDDGYDGPGLRILGTVVNGSQDVAAGLSLAVVAYDNEGAELGTAEAVLSATTLPPGERTRFRAEFTTLGTFTSIRFRPAAAQSFATTGANNPSSEEEAEPY